MIYSLLKPLLFQLDAERAHGLAMDSLQAMHCSGLARQLAGSIPSLPVRVMWLDFPNPLGLAAGLDKHAQYIDALADLGFGFLEIGGVTPRPQPGNPKPRLFRIPEAEAVINRFGFNSVGVDAFVANRRRARWPGIIGVNLGKNADTPNERAVEDYLTSMERIHNVAHFATINVSSPNTKNLRALQSADELDPLLARMHQRREELAQQHGKRLALAIKISVDLNPTELQAVARVAQQRGMDAIIAANTTTTREGVQGLPHSEESGGMSGAPVREKSTAMIANLSRMLDGALPIIGVGGIMSAAHAREKLQAGASLVQLYSGMVFHGPQLIGDILRGLARQR